MHKIFSTLISYPVDLHDEDDETDRSRMKLFDRRRSHLRNPRKLKRRRGR